MTSERETALRHLQEGELVLRLLADRFRRSKSRLDEAFQNVERLKEGMERDGIDTTGHESSPEPPLQIMSDVGFGVIPTDSPTPSHLSLSSIEGERDANEGGANWEDNAVGEESEKS